MIPYGRQDISRDDIDAVIETLTSDFITQGPRIEAFEQAIADRVGAPYALAVNSATSALHLACLALELGPGDALWTSPITFVASANCGRYCGAEVDFVDIDPRTYNLSVEALHEKLIQAERDDRLPKVVVAVHLAGQPCDMKRIAALSRQYGFSVIEDASHAIGATYAGEPVGSGNYSDITVFSFHPVKIITTAEGGMAVTQDEALDARMRSLRSHGITREADRMSQPPDGPWYYEQLDLGYNYRMTDLQAALGVSQISRLDTFIQCRRDCADRYRQGLKHLPLTLPWQHPDGESSWHLYIIRLMPEAPIDHLSLFKSLREAGIGVNLHYIPVHLQPYYRSLGFQSGDFPVSETYYREAISLPLYAGLTIEDQDYVIRVLNDQLSD